MTRSRAGNEGVPSPLAATYYAQRATAGLIISEAAYVAPEGVGYPCTPGIHSNLQMAGWRDVTRAVHDEGGRIFLQLWHVGRVSHPCMQPGRGLPVAPSAISPEGQLFTSTGRQRFVTPRRLDTSEIQGVVDQFAQAALRAKGAGFDGVDLHAANGYLIDQFLRDGTNHRVDRYGGSVINRSRFLLEIVEAVATCWGPDRVGVRVSPLSPYNSMRDSDPLATFSYVASALSDLQVGYLHVAEPGPGHPLATAAGRRLLTTLRGVFPGTLIVDGGRDRPSAEAALSAVDADLVALATPFIANPDLIDRLARDIPLTIADPTTFYGGGEHGYTDYPTYVSHSGEQSARAVMNG